VPSTWTYADNPPSYNTVNTCAAIVAWTARAAKVNLPAVNPSTLTLLGASKQMITPNDLIRDWNMNTTKAGQNFQPGWALDP